MTKRTEQTNVSGSAVAATSSYLYAHMEHMERPQTPRWDQFVRLMRWILPVSALLLGLVTILWPFLNTTEVSFNLSKEEVADSDGKVRMTGMEYVGTDAVDRLFRVQAETGIQNDPGTPQISLTRIEAEMALSDDLLATVTALNGLYKMEENKLALSGTVEIVADNGLSLVMNAAEIDLKTHIATGTGPVEGRGTLGALTSDRMEILVDEGTGIFEGNVKLHIKPRRSP